MNAFPSEKQFFCDEQIIPFTAKHSMNQYMQNKPRKWGFKAFVLCNSNGIVHNWELFTGKNESLALLPDVDVRGNVNFEIFVLKT